MMPRLDKYILTGDVTTIFCSSCGDVLIWERRLPVTHGLLFHSECEHCEPLVDTIDASKKKIALADLGMQEGAEATVAKVSVRAKREASRDAKAAESLLAQRKRIVSSQLSFATTVN